jgi:hypothetical protein
MRNSIRTQSLGEFWSQLPDYLIEDVFSFFDVEILTACSQVSKLFYIFAEEEDQWKTLVIKNFGGNFLFKGTWKRTALAKRHQVKKEPYKKLEIQGFTSDYLYRRWYRANVSLDQWSQLKEQGIDRRSNLSYREFMEEYGTKNIPVIITDITQNWKARTEWTIEKLLKRFNDHKFKTDEVDYFAKTKLYMNFEDYIQYARTNSDEDPIYLFDDKFGERELARDLLNDYEIPKYFQDDYFEALEEERPPYRWFVIGPPRSGSPFHIDPYRTSAWNALLVGRKRWALYPYTHYPPGVDFDWDDDGNFDSDSPEPVKWFVETYPKLTEEQKPLECILEPGEVIFVPSGWWHQVLNLTETICVTQNFCNETNFQTVCAEILFDDDDFYDDFKCRLKAKRPEIVFPTDLQKSGFRK